MGIKCYTKKTNEGHLYILPSQTILEERREKNIFLDPNGGASIDTHQTTMKIEAWGFKPHRKSHHYIIKNYRTHCLRNTDASRALASFPCLVTPVSIPNPHTCLRFNFGPSTNILNVLNFVFILENWGWGNHANQSLNLAKLKGAGYIFDLQIQFLKL